jgi:hypothetical protein
MAVPKTAPDETPVGLINAVPVLPTSSSVKVLDTPVNSTVKASPHTCSPHCLLPQPASTVPSATADPTDVLTADSLWIRKSLE